MEQNILSRLPVITTTVPATVVDPKMRLLKPLLPLLVADFKAITRCAQRKDASSLYSGICVQKTKCCLSINPGTQDYPV
uniref:Bm14297 n=1 Tax=Brugia malayi TaxID=6279 RepID=A0A1I9G4X6_BRUMA|nr:Bm14297 [Brugia malayi]